MEGFSIVICTHNPDKELLSRLFDSIRKFEVLNTIAYEIVLIDSNSSDQLFEQRYIKEFISGVSQVTTLRVDESGLTIARITAIKSARYDWVIFFDDDNEPDCNYIISLAELTTKYPQVKVWGPGKLTVEYFHENSVSEFLLTKRELFQQRNREGIHFDNNPKGSEFYPPGSGMAVHISILVDYSKKVDALIYTMTDRNGKKLTSGGDVQIILNAIRMGYYAGSSSSLILNHIIKKEKLKLKSLLRLQYWLSSSYIKAYNEVFPENAFIVQSVTGKQILLVLYYNLKVELPKNGLKQTLFKLYTQLGEMNSNIVASKEFRRPFLLKIFEYLVS